jgi:hypothetical protein
VHLTRIPSVRLAALRARNFLAFAGSISDRTTMAQGAPDMLMSRIARRATGPAGLEIRPLTLIFGRNSSGKSALIKLIRLALRAIAEPTTDRRDRREVDRDPSPGSRHLPLRIDKLDIAPRFIDLVHGRLPKELGLGLELEADDERCGYDVELLPADTVGDRTFRTPCWRHPTYSAFEYQAPDRRGVTSRAQRGLSDHLTGKPISAGGTRGCSANTAARRLPHVDEPAVMIISK